MADQTKSATYADLEAVPEHLVAEIIDGALLTRSHGDFLPAMVRAAPSFELGSLRCGRSNAQTPWRVLLLPELHFDAISFSLADLWPVDPPAIRQHIH